MKCVIGRWFGDGRLCAPLFVGNVLRWFERAQDAQGPFWQEATLPLPTARWILSGKGVKLRVSFFKDDGTCPDPTGKTPAVRVFVDGGWLSVSYTTVGGVMPLRTRSGRIKTAQEVRDDFTHWAQSVKGESIRKTVARLVADEDPATSYPEEIALLAEVGQNLPDTINAGVDP